jgi:hypothetical protein
MDLAAPKAEAPNVKVTSLDIEAGDQQRYSPPGRCIYCLADGVELTDEHVVPYTAQRLLDYVLGCNALNHGFVSHGERATRRPYHWTCRVRGIVMPGWASGGSNGGAPGADPRLKALIDAKTLRPSASSTPARTTAPGPPMRARPARMRLCCWRRDCSDCEVAQKGQRSPAPCPLSR